MPVLTFVLRLPAPDTATFGLHADVRNLPRITPPPGVRVRRALIPTRPGDIQAIDLGPRWAALRWEARIVALEPPRLLIDEQRRGPFRRFRHAHIVLPDGEGSVLVDLVGFEFFGGPLGPLLDRLLVAPAIRVHFAGRHRRTRAMLTGAGRREDRPLKGSV